MTIRPPSASAMTLTFKLGAGAIILESVSETSRTFSRASLAFETAAAARQSVQVNNKGCPCSGDLGVERRTEFSDKDVPVVVEVRDDDAHQPRNVAL
jgi:hypothetical protein